MESPDLSPQSSDLLAARREARRRKILENAENRLKKLTSVEQKSRVAIDDFRPVNHVVQEEINTTYSSSHHDNFTHFSEPLPSLNTNLPSDSAQINSQQLAERKKDYKIPIIICISCFSNLLLTLSTFIYDDTEKNALNAIFTPLLAYKFIEYFITKNEPPQNSFLLMFLTGYMKNERLKKALSYFGYLSKFIQDLCVYFFVFIVVNHLFKILFVFR